MNYLSLIRAVFDRSTEALVTSPAMPATPVDEEKPPSSAPCDAINDALVFPGLSGMG